MAQTIFSIFQRDYVKNLVLAIEIDSSGQFQHLKKEKYSIFSLVFFYVKIFGNKIYQDSVQFIFMLGPRFLAETVC